MKRYVQCRKTGKLVPREEYYAPRPRLHYAMPDITPYRSMETGEIVGSRSTHREHLRRHGLIEVGNEIKAVTTHTPHRLSAEQRKRDIAHVINHMKG